MAGRPSEFSQDTADLICEKLAEGESLRDICKAGDMPNRATVFRWLSKYEEFSDQYARAREEQAEALADDLISIADQYDTLAETENPDLIQRAKLRIDTRKWVAAKLKPKKYGEKVQTDHTNSDGSFAALIMAAVDGRTRTK